MTNDELWAASVALQEMQDLAQSTLDSFSALRDQRLAELQSRLVKVSSLMGYDAVPHDPRRDGVNRVYGGGHCYDLAFSDWAGRRFS